MTRAGSVLVSAVGLLGVVALLAACSAESAAPAPTIVEPTPVEPTSPPPATDPPPTDPPTTTAPTTTLDPTATLAAEVEADLLEAFRLANDALQDPFDLEKEQLALERRTGFARDALAEKLEDYRNQNLAIRPNPLIDASLKVEVPARLVAEGTDVAELQTCEIDPWIVVEVGAGPDRSDAVVEPGVFAYRSAVFVRLMDGQWRTEGGNEIARWTGVDECPSE